MKNKTYEKSKVVSRLNVQEGIEFKSSPLDFYLMLARYKFAARLLKKDQAVMDAGCGHGLGSVMLSRFCKSVTAIDFNEDHIEANSQEYADVANLEFKKLNLLKPGKITKKFDALVSIDVIEHFEKPDALKVISHFPQFIKKDGFAIVGTPNVNSGKYASPRRKALHPYEFGATELKEILSKHFRHVFLFSMTDEIASLSFEELAWYFMALCIK